MPSRGELKEVQGVDISGLDTGDIAERADDVGVGGVVDDERTKSLTMTTVAGFTSASTEFLRCMHFEDILVSVDAPEESDCFFRLCELREVGVGNDERDLEDFFDAMSTGKDEGGNCSGGDSRGNGVAFLVEIDLDVPFSPCLCGCETTSTTTHVAEGSLSRAVRSSTTNTGDTSNSSSSTPGLSRGLEVSNFPCWAIPGDQLWQRRRMVDACSLQPQCARGSRHRVGWGP